MTDPFSDGNVLYLNCMNISFLIVVLCFGFITRYHWGNWVKSMCDIFIFFFFFTTAQSIYSYIKIKDFKNADIHQVFQAAIGTKPELFKPLLLLVMIVY